MITYSVYKHLINSGRSPGKLTLDNLKKKGISLDNGCSRIPMDSADSVNVPGAVAGWFDTVERFGSGKVYLIFLL